MQTVELRQPGPGPQPEVTVARLSHGDDRVLWQPLFDRPGWRHCEPDIRGSTRSASDRPEANRERSKHPPGSQHRSSHRVSTNHRSDSACLELRVETSAVTARDRSWTHRRPMLTEKMQSPFAGRKASAQIAKPVALASGPMHYRQDDIVLLFVELEHHLHAPELVPRAKVDGCRGTEEIHTVRAVAGPGIKILEIEAGLFLLKKY